MDYRSSARNCSRLPLLPHPATGAGLPHERKDEDGSLVIMELIEQPASLAPAPIVQGADNSDELLNACKYVQSVMSREFVTHDLCKTAMDILSIAIINEEGRRNK